MSRINVSWRSKGLHDISISSKPLKKSEQLKLTGNVIPASYEQKGIWSPLTVRSHNVGVVAYLFPTQRPSIPSPGWRHRGRIWILLAIYTHVAFLDL